MPHATSQNGNCTFQTNVDRSHFLSLQNELIDKMKNAKAPHPIKFRWVYGLLMPVRALDGVFRQPKNFRHCWHNNKIFEHFILFYFMHVPLIYPLLRLSSLLISFSCSLANQQSCEIKLLSICNRSFPDFHKHFMLFLLLHQPSRLSFPHKIHSLFCCWINCLNRQV